MLKFSVGALFPALTLVCSEIENTMNKPLVFQSCKCVSQEKN